MENALHSVGSQVLWEHLASLRPYLDDPTVQEVMINCGSDIWVEQAGQMKKLDITIPGEQVGYAISVLSNLNKKRDAHILDLRMPGLRIAAARHPIAVRGDTMCIRKHSTLKRTVSDYLSSGAFTPIDAERVAGGSAIPDQIKANLAQGGQALVDFLRWAVQTRQTILVSGSTSSGKTTLIGALLDLIQHEDRLIIIEDTGELSELKFDAPNRVHFEANADSGVTIRDLVRLALRYRPTRIVIGEIRGAEAFDMLNAYQTGHPGGLVSLHAESGEEALVSLERKIRMAPEAAGLPHDVMKAEIANAFPFVIHAANAVGHPSPRAPIELIQIHGVRDGKYDIERLYSRFLH